MSIAPPELPLRLRPPAHRVSRAAIRFWAARAAANWLLVVAAQVVWWIAAGSGGEVRTIALAATVLVAAAHVSVMPWWRFQVHRWEITGEAVYTQSGWLTQNRRIAPVSRIQTVDTERGPLEQLFGLTNVTVTTASAAGPLKINGLDHDTARRLVDELTTTTQTHPGDAT